MGLSRMFTVGCCLFLFSCGQRRPEKTRQAKAEEALAINKKTTKGTDPQTNMDIKQHFPIPKEHRATMLPNFWDSNYGPDAYFRPKDSDIERANQAIMQYLKDAKTKDGPKNHDKIALARIKRDLQHYYVQYFGWRTEKQNLIVCNFFFVHPQKQGDSSADLRLWKKEPVNVKGGGSNYWRLYFDVDDGSIKSFIVNAPS